MWSLAGTSAFALSHSVNMKSEDRTETVDSKQTREETVALKYCLAFVKEKLRFLNEIVADELKMSRNTLISIKIGLFLQYTGITLLLYVLFTNSWTLIGHVQCVDAVERDLNDTENLVLTSLCRNPNYRNRFSGIFMLLESMTMVLLLIKLVIGIKNVDHNFQDYLSMRLDNKALFWILLIPRFLLYLVLPFQSLMTAGLSLQFGSLLSVLRSPIMLLFSLIGKLFTLPIAIFFPYPLKSTVEADFARIAVHLGNREKSSTKWDTSSAQVTINCFESCHLRFEWSWYISVLFFLLNFTVVYWFIGFTETLRDVSVEGRTLDSRENCVEFIRVSEVSEDFSFEEEEENRIKEDNRRLNDLGEEEPERVLNEIFDDKIDKSDNLGVPDILTKETQTVAECLSNEKELAETPEKNKEAFDEPNSIESIPSVEGEPKEISKKQNEIVEGKSVIEHPNVNNKVVEHLKEVSQSNKGTQTFSLKLHKGSQTFVPIHLHKKVNKKTQVSPIFVDAQTNTDAVTNGGVTSAHNKEASPSQNGRFKFSKAVEGNGNYGLKNRQNGNVIEKIEQKELSVKEKNESKEKRLTGENGLCETENKSGFENLENDDKTKEFSQDSGTIVEENGCDNREKFGFPELKILPITLDFERRIIRENQIARINVEAFLKCLEKEDDRDVVFVEKDLLLDTFRNIVLTTKALGVEDAVCPRTGTSVDECGCRIHVLIKKFTKREQNDEVDGLKMETEDDDYSDDESYFNGFRL